jgi:hypothetical protein
MGDEEEQRPKRRKIVSLNEDAVPTDTELVLRSMLSCATSQGIAFLHQLHVTMKNKSIIDEELAQLRTSSRAIKCMQCLVKQATGSKSSTNTTAILWTDAYIDSIPSSLSKSCTSPAINVERICEKFSAWVSYCSNISMSRTDLRREPGDRNNNANAEPTPASGFLSDIEIDVLVQAGFLNYRNSTDVDDYAALGGSTAAGEGTEPGNELFWLSHPMLR